MRVLSLNMNGIRSACRKGFLEWLPQQQADIVCLQETRIQDHQLTPDMLSPDSMHASWLHATRPGYSGVAILSRRKPDRVRSGIGHPEFDAEGRLLEADFGRLTVASLYLPSGSSSDERQARKERFMMHFTEWLVAKRASRRHVLICGDWNIAHTEKDLKNWKGNKKNSGFLPGERAWMDGIFHQAGWIDTFRSLHLDAEGAGYTWWSNRGQAYAKNVGWRIDYQVATPGLGKLCRNSRVIKDLRMSDHAPLEADFEFDIPR